MPVSEYERLRRIRAAQRRAELGLLVDGVETDLELFYLSFTDPNRPKGTQWLGACIVPAPDAMASIATAHMLSCNPGGEAKVVGPLPRETIKPDYVGRLLTTKEEVDEAGTEV